MRVTSELNVRFRANKTGLSPLTVFIPIVPERSLCCTSFFFTCAPEVLCLATCTSSLSFFPLRKQAYTNILKISQPKNEKFSDKNSDIFHISAQNIDGEAVLTSTHILCFRAEIRKIIYTPVNPSFTI